MESNIINIALDSAVSQCNNFKSLKANLFSTDIFIDKASDPELKTFTAKRLDLEY